MKDIWLKSLNMHTHTLNFLWVLLNKHEIIISYWEWKLVIQGFRGQSMLFQVKEWNTNRGGEARKQSV